MHVWKLLSTYHMILIFSIFAILNINWISLFSFWTIYAIQGTFKCHIRHFGLLKLSLLLDNGEAHSRSHFTALKAVFKLHFSYLYVSYNFFKMSSPTTCLDLSQTKITGAVKTFLCKYTMHLVSSSWIYKQVNKLLVYLCISGWNLRGEIFCEAENN